MITNYQTVPEFMKEVEVAIKFDLRDNPKARDLVSVLTVKKGEAGKRAFLDAIEKDIKKEYDKTGEPPLFPWTRAAFKTYVTGAAMHEKFGLGIWGAAIGAAVQAVAAAGSTIYAARLNKTTQIKLAKMEQKKAAAEAASAERVAAAQAKAAETSMKQQTSGFKPTMSTLGKVGLPVLAVGGAAAFLFFKLKG